MAIFTVFWMVFKQTLKNWRLELVLLFGLILAVAISSCIPIYTDGVLQRVMTEKWQGRSSINFPPGAIQISDEQWYDYHPLLSETQWRDQDEAFEQYLYLDKILQKAIPEVFGTEVLHFSKTGRTDRKTIIAAAPLEETVSRYADLCFITGLDKQVELVAGRWFSNDIPAEGEPIEVVIDENASYDLNLKVGNIYRFPLETEKYEENRYLDLKVVGVFRVQKEAYNKPVWVERPPFTNSFFMAEEVFEKVIRRDDTRPYRYSWYWLMDHEPVRYHRLADMISRFKRMETEIRNISGTIRINQASLLSLEPLIEQGETLKRLLLILSLPVLGMIFYYIILTASLTIKRRSNEIALLRSRGSSVFQIVISYLLEWGFLSVFALFAGPQLGLLIARLMGASAGFLDFVSREALPVIIPPDAYFYIFITIAAALGSCLFLVIPAAGESIVSYKQKIARENRKPFWQRYYLDFFLLIFSIYGYRQLSKQIVNLQRGATAGSQHMLDPLLFLIPVLFLATAGLLSLRIIPWLIRIISFFVEKLPEISLTVTLRQFFRNSGQYSPLIFFIIMTVSLGIYSSSIARTLEQNFIDSLMYEHGAEVVLTERWHFDTPVYSSDGQLVSGDSATVFEPPFHIHKELTGVKDAARVFTRRGSISIGGRNVANGTLMAIDPVDFAHVSWFRDDLAEEHFYYYLNLLIDYEDAVLVNREFFEKNQLNLGEWVSFRIGFNTIDFFVAGVIDYWPTIYPSSFPLLVGNLDYVQSQYIIEPYNVWLSLEEDASLQLIVDELREEGIWVTSVKDVRTRLVEGRRDPERMGIFGILSISFVVAVLITVMGFFLYNFLSLRKRVLEFGVMRAIGLSISQLITILSLEQFLTVGAGFSLGTLFGVIVSQVFLPFLQVSQNLDGVVPGFRIIVQRSDISNILIILGISLVIGLLILAFILIRLKLHEAIKLGEEV
ncbi:MAG: FtsX-like permease family protein [Halanaerobiales bacterium]